MTKDDNCDDDDALSDTSTAKSTGNELKSNDCPLFL